MSWTRQASTLALAALFGLNGGATAESRPRPGSRPAGFRLMARATGALTINRVYCGLSAAGEVCVDSTHSNATGGGFWPKGTADQYIFNSGFQLAGVITGDQSNPWAGDTSSATFFNPAGFTDGEPVVTIFNQSDPNDLANWPAAGHVPKGDASEELFNPLLRDQPTASQGDVWWVTWDGNPAITSLTTRPHPLGVLLEQRGMGWNFPAGNEDVVYFIYTVYNITSSDPADYANVRPAMREILLEKAHDFQRLNNQAYGVTLPARGYAIRDLYVAFAADMDVAQAGLNYATVNLPFALGYTYDHSFSQLPDWTFDPAIFGPPFFPGSGFAGVKYLRSPSNAAGEEVGIKVFSNTINQGSFPDAANSPQLYRYLSANLDPGRGDSRCNNGDPRVTRICFINNTQPDDIRFFQSSGPLSLAPGEFGSVVVAYIFAAPVQDPSCTPPCAIRPGDPTILGDKARMEGGVNPVDRMTGYLGFADANGDDRVEQREFQVVPGSLLGKALVAQAVFDSGFLLPFAPEPPPFYLVPGDNQVTVLWQPSRTESVGDPFFSSASSPTIFPPEGGAPVPNPLFDPNYRQFDVEGYRIYRGRVDSPNDLALIAQFDYRGTVINDFQGQVNPVPGCAPELGINTATVVGTDTSFACPVPFDSLEAGVAPNASIAVPLVGPIVQVRRGGRARLATGVALVLKADTAMAQVRELEDTGVPFAFLDQGVRSNLRYFYAVTAFDINSFQSGPSSIESPRTAHPVVPQAPAPNFQSTATIQQSIEGRSTLDQDTTPPLLDPATGRFSGRFPPTDAISLNFAGQFAQTIYTGSGHFSARLIGLGLGNARHGIPVTYTYETRSTSGTLDTTTVGLIQPSSNSIAEEQSDPFDAAAPDPELSSRVGVPAGFLQKGRITQRSVSYQQQTAFGRGCFGRENLFGGSCTYNGPRWFQGANETKAHPNSGNARGSGNATDNNNAGELPAVLTIQNPQSYTQLDPGYSSVEAILAGAVRAADFNMYWGTGGRVDSVVDLTHDVPVPFMAESLGGGWGFLNQTNSTAPGSADRRPEVLTLLDYGCVFPLNDPTRDPDQELACSEGTTYTLSQTATLGKIAIYGGADTMGTVAPPRANPGFSIYLAGHIFLFELAPGAALPSAPAVWTLRSYVGHINGGKGTAGDEGLYAFSAAPQTFSALGASVSLTYQASNNLTSATDSDLSRVHTVPDPYYVTNQFERTTQGKVLQFVNLPADAIIRIYSSSGVLIDLLEHHSSTFGGAESWNLRSRNNQVVASGVYFYHIESGGARKVGRFTLVNFAE